MERRKFIASTAIAVSLPLVGCLDETPGGAEDQNDGENDGGDGSGLEEFTLQISNRIDQEVECTVEAVSNGEELVSDTYSVDAETIEEIGTVPEGESELTVEATEHMEERSVEETFDLTEEEPLEAVEIQLQDVGNLQINPLGYDTPA